MWEAKIILDSIAPCGQRLTTMQWTYPRWIHSEVNTHRALSKNAASSRAIPIDKMIKMVEENPAIPIYFGRNQKGMQAVEEIENKEKAEWQWRRGAKKAVLQARRLQKLKLHKQHVNRVLEPYMWMTTLLTGTDYAWDNLFLLRRHTDAQPEFKYIADMAYDVRQNNQPEKRNRHLPFIDTVDELRFPNEPTALFMISAARCARLSYLTQDGIRDYSKDLELAEKLLNGSDGIGHLTPFEHQAWPLFTELRSGNFVGWEQYRKVIEKEMKKTNVH